MHNKATGILYHLAGVLWQSCNTIMLFHLLPMVPVFGAHVVFPGFLMVTAVDKLCTSAWYGFVLSLTCKENAPLKHPIPVNTYCINCVFSVLFLHSQPRKLLYYSLKQSSLFHILFCYWGMDILKFLFVLDLSCLFIYLSSFLFIIHGYWGICSTIVVSHSPASPVMLAHCLALQRNCIKTQCTY